MLRTTMKKTLLASLLSIAVVAAATPASALAPTRERFVDEGWFTMDFTAEGTPAECAGFTEELVSERIEITTFYNRHGDAVRVAMHARFEGEITNPSGETIRDHAVFSETQNLKDGTTIISGISYHYVRKGMGSVYAEIGHKIQIVTEDGEVVEILKQSGQDDWVESEMAGLCTALS
jgi:hypothetical protein